MADLAAEASLSQSAFFARFSRVVDLPPMEYLLAWRMALAKQLLRGRDLGMEEVAEPRRVWLGKRVQRRLLAICGRAACRYASKGPPLGADVRVETEGRACASCSLTETSAAGWLRGGCSRRRGRPAWPAISPSCTSLSRGDFVVLTGSAAPPNSAVPPSKVEVGEGDRVGVIGRVRR